MPMSAGSFAAYREAGALCREQDDPELPGRHTRCACGAFLPATTAGSVTCQEPRVVRYEDVDGYSVPVVTEWDEWQEPATTCRRCGKVYAESQMWEVS